MAENDLHPNWEYLINAVVENGFGKIEELTFEKGVPVNFKTLVRNVNIGAEVRKKEVG